MSSSDVKAVLDQALQSVMNELAAEDYEDEDIPTHWISYYRGQHDMIMYLMGELT